MLRCPGQDQRFWKLDDIFEVKCPDCGQATEFFKDEPKLKCRRCGQVITNPKIEPGCKQWCKYSEKCNGILQTWKTAILSDKPVDEKIES